MLTLTEHIGSVVSLLTNQDPTDLSSTSQPSVAVDYTGFVGDVHSGLTRMSCVRVRQQYAKGTEIRNTRQISALSLEELQLIASAMGIARLDPGWLGANLIVEGIVGFSQLPPSSRLIFDHGVALVVDMENSPCRFPGDIIEKHCPGKGRLFAKAALHLRGVTLWVERGGSIKCGEGVNLHVPPPVNWPIKKTT